MDNPRAGEKLPGFFGLRRIKLKKSIPESIKRYEIIAREFNVH